MGQVSPVSAHRVGLEQAASLLGYEPKQRRLQPLYPIGA